MIAPALATATATDRIVLTGLRLRSRIRGMAQRTTLEQVFINREDRDIEAIYTFPLPEDAAVCRFEIEVADRVLTGRIEELEKAFDEYDDAIGEGSAAFLLEQDRPDVFTVHVGNLKPSETASIRLTYVAPVPVTGRTLRLAFPTTIAPRYVSPDGVDPRDLAIEGDVLNPPHLLDVPYGLDFEIDLDLGARLGDVRSPSHRIRTEQRDSAVRVTPADGPARPDRDVVLEVELTREQEPWAQVGDGPDGERFVAVSFLPEFDEQDLDPPPPADVAFVLDCSGSMQGRSIRQAKAALELCLRSLSGGDRFNIYRFGSTWEAMSAEPLVYDQPTLDEALRYVHRIDADLGGTEILTPLRAIMESPPAGDAVRQVVLLTDGQVANEDAVVDLARSGRDRNRVFAFGIGPASSAYLVTGMARATRGAAEFITEGERIEDKVLRVFGRIASPAVTEARVDWGRGVRAEQSPAEIPPVFDGEAATVYARVKGKLPGEMTLTVSTSHGRRAWTVPLPPPADDGRTLATIWARHAIRDLEEAGGGRGVRWRGRPPRHERRLIDLSRRYELPCRLTTFIAVMHRSLEERNAGMPETRRVPIMLARGWHGVEACMLGERTVEIFGRSERRERASMGICADSVYDSPETTANLIQKQRGSTSKLRRLLAAQQADGSFGPIDLSTVTTTSRKALARWEKQVRERLEQRGLDPDRDDFDSVVHTCLCLLLLYRSFAATHALWQRPHNKAARWLADTTGETAVEIVNTVSSVTS